jgi:DUF1365 family protein
MGILATLCVLAALAVRLVAGVALCATVFVLLPFVLAGITLLRQPGKAWQTYRSSLYYGRVWHTRYTPIHHAFEYPFFLFCLDLDEVENGRLFEEQLWPLSILMYFRECDHLKNGEGNGGISGIDIPPERLSSRILRLVSERTEKAFEPTLESHRILLVTHLCYYGYCFNPVSFYYVQNRATTRTDAVVGEVSNTPWNEMHAYVLHEKSVDDVSVSVLPGKVIKPLSGETMCDDEASSPSKINYVFPKGFHVSPFMEMEYMYDWTFSEMFSTTSSNNQDSTTTIRIVNDMRSKADDTLAFRARMQVDRKSLHPFRAAWHLASYPVYCMIIQVWIHYQAFWLFLKGVTFQPHPQGSETTVSRIIGNIMVPFFAMQDVFRGKNKEKES